MQGKQETFDSYLTKLKIKIADCAFGNLHDSLLRDQVVRGICSDKVRELLLSERELTLKKALDICRASEQATIQLKEMNIPNTSNEILSVQKVNSKPKPGFTKTKVNNVKHNNLCWRCGLSHDFKKCPAFNVFCSKCHRKGHYARQCSMKSEVNRIRDKRVHELTENDNNSEEIDTSVCDTLHIGELFDVVKKEIRSNSWFTTATFQNGVNVKFKLDTGAEGDVITKAVMEQLSVPLRNSHIKRLKTFNNSYIPVLGEVHADCTIQNKSVKLKLIVVDGNFSCVLGCDTCEQLNLIKRNDELASHLSEVKLVIPDQIFEGIGCIKNFEYDIELQEGAVFTIHPPRRIPYALRDTVKKEIDLMVKTKILKPVTYHTPAVSPLVIVKQGDRVRLCLDPTDINKAIKRHHFPLKTVEDIAARIGSAKYFTLLDAKKGFWQLPVSKRTSDYLTVNTPWGRFSFLRVPFGLASAPEIFQQVMQSILVGFNNVECSMDDILLWANTQEDLRNLTESVLRRLFDRGVRLNKQKCEFGKTKIKFLGHIFTSTGIEIDPSKVKAIDQLKTPTCVTELQRFMGMLNYVSKFIPNYSKISEPLRRLLQKNVIWEWSTDQEKAFHNLKESLKNTPKLAYYDVNKPVVVSVDASSHAVGAVLLQEGRPIAFSTKSLTPAQQRYPQIEKEAFAIRYGCKKFHDYIYGKSVVIETDHKPLETIVKKPLHLAPPRLQRLLFDVIQYAPKVIYKRGVDIPIPDALSRDCVVDPLDESSSENETFEVVLDVPLPLTTFPELVSEVCKDEELQQLKSLILTGWPNTVQEVPQQLRKYWNYREELTVYEDLLFKSNRLVVPKSLQDRYLKLIHLGHLGINLSLHRAREVIFWHGMSLDIEAFVRRCPVCQKTSRDSNTEPLLMKPVPQFPWQRVASDLFQCLDETYCLVVDSYSGYFDFKKLRHPTSQEVIEYLKDCFATHGIPDILESDNGPQYSSDAFRDFTRKWAINHQTSSPHYPRSNGLAERYVQVAKGILKRSQMENSDHRLALLNWRNTPRKELPSPAQRLFGRPTRTLIPIHPSKRIPRDSYSVPLQSAREKQRVATSTSSRNIGPVLTRGENVRLKTSHRNWVPATISAPTKYPRSYFLTTADGSTFRRNSHVIRPTKAAISPERDLVVRPSPPDVAVRSPSANPVSSPSQALSGLPKQSALPLTITRSGRIVRPPERLDL